MPATLAFDAVPTAYSSRRSIAALTILYFLSYSVPVRVCVPPLLVVQRTLQLLPTAA